ncbi:MAG TPA: hypothetical protein VJS30_03990, partial [Paraburkholderia sp.]|nr:hypothetical protein [Paraburkholderia sp.]
MSVAEYFRTMDYGPAPEDDQPVRAWLAQHEGTFGHFIDGASRASASGQRFEVRAPATGELLAAVAQGDADDVAAA